MIRGGPGPPAIINLGPGEAAGGDVKRICPAVLALGVVNFTGDG